MRKFPHFSLCIAPLPQDGDQHRREHRENTTRTPSFSARFSSRFRRNQRLNMTPNSTTYNAIPTFPSLSQRPRTPLFRRFPRSTTPPWHRPPTSPTAPSPSTAVDRDFDWLRNGAFRLPSSASHSSFFRIFARASRSSLFQLLRGRFEKVRVASREAWRCCA